jgi:hypothetical protein
VQSGRNAELSLTFDRMAGVFTAKLAERLCGAADEQ